MIIQVIVNKVRGCRETALLFSSIKANVSCNTFSILSNCYAVDDVRWWLASPLPSPFTLQHRVWWWVSLKIVLVLAAKMQWVKFIMSGSGVEDCLMSPFLSYSPHKLILMHTVNGFIQGNDAGGIK